MDSLLELAAQLGAEHVKAASERHVGWRAEAAELEARLGRELSLDGDDGETVLRELAADAEPGLVATTGAALLRVRDRRGAPGRRGGGLAHDGAGTRTAVDGSPRRPPPSVEEVAGGWLNDLLGLPAGVSSGSSPEARWRTSPCLAAARHRCWPTRAGTSSARG